MSLDNYVAFYVAGDCNQIKDAFFEYVHNNTLLLYTIAYEVSESSHEWCQGAHVHILAKWSDKDYRAFIAKLKTLGIPMNGRSIKGQPRNYGKVKHIRDFDKMLAYTIKGGDFISTENPELIQKCKELSYEKQDLISILREKICIYLDETITFTLKPPMTFGSPGLQPEKGFLHIKDYEMSLLGNIKLNIIHYFRQSKEKMPCKSRVLYYAQYYLMYHRTDVPDEQILQLFY
jgi:hypothetical protein